MYEGLFSLNMVFLRLVGQTIDRMRPPLGWAKPKKRSPTQALDNLFYRPMLLHIFVLNSLHVKLQDFVEINPIKATHAKLACAYLM